MSAPPHRTNAALPSLDGPIPALFCAAGGALTLVGALPWIAVLAGDGGVATGWPLRIIGVLAFTVGAFVALVGIGLFRARAGLRAAAAEAELDATLVAAAASAVTVHDPCATDTACASCDATCALSALR